jgi:hypothetical protein
MGRIDLSKLNIKKINDLRWEIDIEHEIILPVELGGNKIITKTVEFDYYKDKQDNYWLKNCNIPEEYQEQGIGSMMIKIAIKEYGQVYFSNADRIDFNTKYPKHGYDSRYLTTDGKKFVEALIRKNDIPADWHRFPEI